jgi:thioredoxin reductase
MLDEVPDIPGFRCVGNQRAHLPHCDGYERLAVLAVGGRGEHLAVLLCQWSDDVVLLSNGPQDLAADSRGCRQSASTSSNRPSSGWTVNNGRLRRVWLGDGQTLDRDALFFYVGWRLRNDVARTLGCELRDDGSIAVDANQATTVDRVYAAGNCSEPRALVPAAAGSGTTAAVAINAQLCFEDADGGRAGPGCHWSAPPAAAEAGSARRRNPAISNPRTAIRRRTPRRAAGGGASTRGRLSSPLRRTAPTRNWDP